MAWRRPGDKPLSEPVMVSLMTHICVTRPQWVNNVPISFDRCRHSLGMMILMNANVTERIYNMMTSSNGNISELLALCVGNSPVTSVGNSHRSASPRPTTLEEDRELFVDFSSISCLWFEIQGMRTYNFFDWVSNTAGHRWIPLIKASGTEL